MTFLRSGMFLRLLGSHVPHIALSCSCCRGVGYDILVQPGTCPSGLVENEMCGLGTPPRSPLTGAYCSCCQGHHRLLWKSSGSALVWASEEGGA